MLCLESFKKELQEVREYLDPTLKSKQEKEKVGGVLYPEDLISDEEVKQEILAIAEGRDSPRKASLSPEREQKAQQQKTTSRSPPRRVPKKKTAAQEAMARRAQAKFRTKENQEVIERQRLKKIEDALKATLYYDMTEKRWLGTFKISRALDATRKQDQTCFEDGEFLDL